MLFDYFSCQISLFCYLVVAAATENYDNSKDDDPCAVVVEKMAQAVVVHKNMFLRCMLALFSALIYIICGGVFCDTDWRKIQRALVSSASRW